MDGAKKRMLIATCVTVVFSGAFVGWAQWYGQGAKAPAELSYHNCFERHDYERVNEYALEAFYNACWAKHYPELEKRPRELEFP